ncbi:23 kDa jasmonate-induced protein [Sorghum bicolor]|uniref:23 kDa jasmonate-induced protein n=1 Tax=Sorghum bicolor TaxID=4558 RepID=UPI0001A84069|nr:23 kDa jasmonate-induced protein [Sorghum bicolor]|eukprot:XP_021310333.1 23 kDa jasmonate-induced protein [Sorghum bicolor]
MASGVFGLPISEETVRATGEYKEPITQRDVADYAMKMINANEKDVNAQKFVDNLKDRYGNGITTKCLIYNATGASLKFVTYKDWHGHIYETPYPSEIQNGQWGAFIHVHPAGAARGSAGAAVYRTKIPSSSSSCDWLFSWSIPYIGDSSVYTEIREEGHFPPHWDYIYDARLERSGRSSTDNGYGYHSQTDIGEGTTVNARAVFKLPN